MPSLEASRVLVMTDVVDSTLTTTRLGDARAAQLWVAHDRMARDLLATWRGREIDKSDGFLLLFDVVDDAIGYALAYQRALAGLQPPLQARAAVHRGTVLVRETPPHDVARGAKPLEVDGAAKPTAARIMALARAGQTLVSAPARSALPAGHTVRVLSHGHWRFKGIDEPVELFEAGADDARFAPPPDGPKGWRVVRRGDLWLPARDVPLTLPAERDRFIDREANLRDLAERFARGARMVSVLGPGGTGKTRFALRFGWTWLGDFEGGVWFCDLNAVRHVDGIVHAMAQGLKLELTGADPGRQLIDAIAGRGECLIIVDNFEQVVAHAEATVGRWMERAAEARFIVTTRERLRIVGEDTLELPALGAADAATLLRERAASAGSARFTPQDEAAVPELVALLDGLPLALELAASRMRVLPPAGLLPRMGERFRMLASTRRGHDRQATLRATLDWSWDLLTAAERSALAQASVFENGFTLEAAEAVIDLSACGDAPWTGDVVQSLVDKSLLRKVGESRFDLLRNIRDYAAEQLPAQARASAATAHARHFHEWLDRIRPAVINSDRGALQELDAEFENCRAAWAFAVAHGQADALMRSSLTLLNFSDHRGRFEEVRALLRAAIDSRPAATEPRYEPLLSSGLAHLEYRLDRYAEAQNIARRALVGARALRDLPTRLQCYKVLGACSIALGRHAQAARHLSRALRMSLASADAQGVASMLDNLALVEKGLGHYDESQRLSAQSLAEYRSLGDVAGEALCLNNLGALQMDLNKLDAATSNLNQALVLSQRHDLISTCGLVLANLTELAMKSDDPPAALEYAQAARKLAKHTGSRTVESWLELQLARIWLRQRDLAAARSHLRSALEIAVAIDRPSFQREGIALFAELLAAQGEPGCARRVLDFAMAHPSLTPHERNALRPNLDRWEPAPFAEPWPGPDHDGLVGCIVAETDLAYAPLIALLRAAP